MKNLYKYLVPFAGDYSGVCSALFDMGGMICIHDAAGCTGNFTHFDEPRYYGSNKLVYCTGLRKIDAILGNEDLYKNKIINAAKEMNPKFIAIVGSPVPHIIGFDFNGFAKEIEFLTGIPCFGFPTNGMSGNYKDGIVTALKTIIKRFGPAADEQTQTEIKNDTFRVNIIGLSPLDISMDNYHDIISFFNNNGIKINLCLSIDESVDNVKNLLHANLNLAFSQAGYLLCKHLEALYGMPFLAGLPVGERGGRHYLARLKEVALSRQSGFSFETQCIQAKENTPAVLIPGDAIISASIAENLYLNGASSIQVFSLFGKDSCTTAMNIPVADGEESILKELNSEIYETVIADPIILGLINDDSHISKIELPQYAISSRIGASSNKLIIGSAFDSQCGSKIYA